jgi:FkbM family methyltransferase
VINFSAVPPQSLTGRLVRYPFKLIPPDLALPVLQGPLRGQKWIVGSHLHGCWLGSYEWKMQRRIVREVRPGSVFFDVGANVGFYSLLGSLRVGALRAEAGRVYAFEPLPANISFLHHHLELNRIRNVEVLEVAISDQPGSMTFASETTRAMGKLDAGGGLTVQVATLDQLIAEGRAAPPECIKMDIEGGEFRALLGAAECFRKFRPRLFLATHGKAVHDDCCRLLRSWDYEWFYMAHESDERAELFAEPRAAATR